MSEATTVHIELFLDIYLNLSKNNMRSNEKLG
jgi:hypothetical protein